MVPGVIEQAKSVFLRTNPMLSKDLNEVAVKLRADYAPRGAEIVNDVAKLYATRFTEQELKDALAFYKSPLGRKLLAEEPKVLDQGMKHAQTWANKLSEEVIEQDARRNEEARARNLRSGNRMSAIGNRRGTAIYNR